MSLPSPDHNGWYTNPVTANITGTSFSGGVSCGSSTYTGPDATNATVTGTCTDNAGKTSTTPSSTFKYEASTPAVSSITLPSPDHNGWYTNPVTASLSGSSFSGIASCTSSTYTGPDSKAASVTGTCTDNAGKTTAAATSAPFQFEASSPTVSISLPQPDHNGWYTTPVTANVSGTSFSGGVSCGSSTYAGPDATNATVTASCSDNAGKTTAKPSSPFQFEASSPAISVGLPAPDHNGWYTNPVTANVAGTSFSGGVSCGSSTYTGPDATNATVTGTCTDNAGKTSTTPSSTFKYEASNPAVSVTLPAPDHNGWYTNPVTANVTGSAFSGGVSCASSTYSGPDTTNGSVTGTCSDNAGKTSSKPSSAFNYEASTPSISSITLPPPDHNNWYTTPVTATLKGNSFSGIASCTSSTYSTPDSKAASVSGTCTDSAGKTTAPSTSASFQYEASSPTITSITLPPPDHNNWYTNPVTATLNGSSFSGGVSCASSTYSGPDTKNATVTGTCTDNAGKSVGGSSPSLQYEASSPTVSIRLSRPADFNGWYTHPVDVTLSGSSFSGGVACTPQTTYSGPDSPTASVDGSCTDNAGKTTSASTAPFQYEGSGPAVDVTPSRSPDSNGWYTSPVAAKVSGSSVSGIVSCTQSTYSGPDSTDATLTGSCTDNAGETNSGTSTPFSYEATSPSVSITAARPADSNGWYNHPVTGAVHESSYSGIVSCTTPTYSGPDAMDATLTATCRDKAGKTIAATTVFRYDSSPPLGGLRADPGDRIVKLKWTRNGIAPLTALEITRTPGPRGRPPLVVYRGTGNTYTDRHVRNGVRYRYTFVAVDQAGNVGRGSLSTTAGPRLIAPAQSARIVFPAALTWTPVHAASYYNVQLYAHGRKIFTAWPTTTSLELKRVWRFGGHRYRLLPGRYRWYVWPGYGRRKAARYGQLIGGSTFTVT